MGHGSSLPSEYKQKIQAAFQIKNTEAWRNADDFDPGFVLGEGVWSMVQLGLKTVAGH